MILTILTLTSFAVLVRIVANPLSNVFQKQLTQRSANPLFILSVMYGVLTLVGLVFWPQLRFYGLPIEFWQSMLVSSLFAMFGNVFLVRAMHIGDLSVLGPINAYKRNEHRAVVNMMEHDTLLINGNPFAFSGAYKANSNEGDVLTTGEFAFSDENYTTLHRS